MRTHVTTPTRMILAALVACQLRVSLAAGIPLQRTELAQIGTHLNRGDEVGPIVNGEPIAHRSSDVQVLDKNEKIELYVLIPGETDEEDSEQDES